MVEEPTAALRVALRDLRRLLIGVDYPPRPVAAPRRWRRWRTYLVPAALFALIGLTAAAAQYLQDNRDLPELFAIVFGVGSTVPAALAVNRPLWAWRIGYPMLYLGVIDADAAEGWPWNPVQIVGYLVVLAVLAVRADTGVAAWAGALSLSPVYLFVPALGNAHGVTVLVAAVLILGDQVRRRRQSQRALAEQTELSELEKARRAVLEERTRIAREMHDVVAHHMSMIAVQAETAPYRLGAVAAPASAEFTAIAASAREALTDMRRLLGVLRSEPGPQTAPQPGLGDIPPLVDTARRAGMTVTLDLPAAPPPAPPTAGLAAYRVVQEALANAARHAPGAAVRVTVTAAPGELGVRVDNDPPPGRPAAGSAGQPIEAGHGLAGMRERTRLLGGRLTATHTDEGGFRVVATLPYAAEEGAK